MKGKFKNNLKYVGLLIMTVIMVTSVKVEYNSLGHEIIKDLGLTENVKGLGYIMDEEIERIDHKLGNSSDIKSEPITEDIWMSKVEAAENKVGTNDEDLKLYKKLVFIRVNKKPVNNINVNLFTTSKIMGMILSIGMVIFSVKGRQ